MSLLLDALKEAENRHRRAPVANPAAPVAVAVEVDDVPDPELVLADDIAPPPPAAPARAAAASPAMPNVTALRAARAPERSPAAAVPPAGTVTPPRKQSHLVWLIAALAVVVLILGGAYLYLTTSTPIAPPQGPPPINEAAVRAGLILTDDPADAATVSDAAPSVLPPATGIPAVRPARVEPAPHAAPGAAPRATSRATPIGGQLPGRADSAVPNHVIIEGKPSPLVQAHAALRAGDLAQAERLYRETLFTQPDQPDAHLGLAMIEQARGNTTAAVAQYRAVLTLVPAQPQAWAGLSDLAGDAELDTMESQLRGLIAARPEASLHFALGNLLARQSRWSDAQQSFFAASTAAPQNADYAFNLGVALDRLGKGKVALTHYARALALTGDARAVQFDVAAVRQRLAELQGATP